MRKTTPRNRKGAVLPLVAVLMVVIVMFAGLVFDMSRAYAQKNELQTVADAAALAGVIELIQDTTGALTTAQFYGGLNHVMSRFLPTGNTQPSCGIWDDDSRTFTPSGTCGATENAVSLVVHDTATFTFPALFGLSSRPISATARAWAAYVDGASCIKPWGLNYEALTRVLDPGWPQVQQCEQSGGVNCDQHLQKDPSREFDQEDMQNLQTRSPESLRFSVTEAQPPTQPGNFGALRLPGDQGAADYRTNISGCHPTLVIPGMTLTTEPGLMGDHTGNGTRNLCTQEGSLGPAVTIDPGPPAVTSRQCFDSNGDLGLPVIAVLWQAPPLQGASQVTVRRLVTFKIETVTSDNVITGRFAPGIASGRVTSHLSTIQRPILVD